MNSGRIVKNKKHIEYVQLENSLVQSKILSLQEKGLLAYLLSLPNDWVLYKKNLHENVNESKGTTDRVFKLLQEKRYIKSNRIHDKRGNFVGWEHIVYDVPYELEPTSIKTDIGESQPIQINNSITNKDIVQKPEVLNFPDDESNNAWKSWITYRKEIKKPLSPSTIEMQLRKLEGVDQMTRVKMINQSIENGWQGLYELKQKSNGKPNITAEINSIYSGLE